MKGIRIVSDGTSNGTKIYTSDGCEITGYTSVDLRHDPPLEPGSNNDGTVGLPEDVCLSAVVTFRDIEIDILNGKEGDQVSPPSPPSPPPGRDYRGDLYIDPDKEKLAGRILRRLGMK